VCSPAMCPRLGSNGTLLSRISDALIVLPLGQGVNPGARNYLLVGGVSISRYAARVL
jgi:hypothetical protein